MAVTRALFAIAVVAWLGAWLGACAPSVDGPIEHQRAIDREDGDRLSAQIALLPGVVGAQVVLHHAARDPLALTPAAPAVFSAVVTTDDAAAPDAVRDAAIRLARAIVPELGQELGQALGPELGHELGASVAVEVVPVVHRPKLAKVGPFWVEDTSQRALRATLAIGCLAIAVLAALIARRYRRGTSAQ